MALRVLLVIILLVFTVQVTPAVKLSIKFSEMTQSNMSTGWRRDIRCTSIGPSPSTGPSPSAGPSPGHCWEWEDEHGKWNAYSPQVQRLLEACQLCVVKQCEMVAMGRGYRVELGGQCVQTNLSTKVQRKVRQQGSPTTTTTTTDTDAGELGDPVSWVIFN